MYKGTLIRDLMATVERAERSVQARRLQEEMELERLFKLQIPVVQAVQTLVVGAA